MSGGVVVFVRRSAVGDAQVCFGGEFQAHIATGFSPFVGLFHQHGVDQSDDHTSVGQDPDHIGVAVDLFVQPFLGVDAPMDVKSGMRAHARR